MRGKPQAQPDFLTLINLNQCVPADHPLRAIKSQVDTVLKKLSPLFDELYAEDGRASIPPEQLVKARVFTALYSVRSERLFCEQLSYNLLWLWFLDRESKAVLTTASLPRTTSACSPLTWPNSSSSKCMT